MSAPRVTHLICIDCRTQVPVEEAPQWNACPHDDCDGWLEEPPPPGQMSDPYPRNEPKDELDYPWNEPGAPFRSADY